MEMRRFLTIADSEDYRQLLSDLKTEIQESAEHLVTTMSTNRSATKITEEPKADLEMRAK